MTPDDATIENEQRYRAAAYSLLAAMLRAAPEQALLDHLVELSPDSDVEPDELTQATFVALVGQLERGYEERGRFESWLFRIAMNGLRDEMRRRKRQAIPMDMSPAAGGDESGPWVQSVTADGDPPPDQLIRREQVARLRAAVANMGEADRQVLHLRHTAGLSFAQIADTLGQPLGTVLARGHRGRKAHPSGRLSKEGVMPGICASGWPRRLCPGTEPIKPRVYGCSESSSTGSTSPASTIFPAYMTQT